MGGGGGRGPFGRQGTGRGCVGLADMRGGQGDTPGQWFFDHSLLGDVVVVKNSPDRSVAPDNGLNGFNGWNMEWGRWIAGSAVRRRAAPSIRRPIPRSGGKF